MNSSKSNSIERGLKAARAGDFQRARVNFAAALKSDPNDFDALQLLGNAHLFLDDFARAQDAFHRALQIDPTFPPLLMNFGVCLARQGDQEQAIAFYEKAILARPRYADALFNKALSCNVLRRSSEALACLDSVASSHGQRVDYLIERAKALAQDQLFDEALNCIQLALEREPNAWKTLHARGTIYLDMGRLIEARADHEKALSLAPGDAGLRLNLAYLQLGAGELREGWDGYERRFEANTSDLRHRHPIADAIIKAPPVRKAQNLARAKILAVGEQGLGDTIMFASILPDLLALTPSVNVCVEPRLEKLIARSFPMVGMEPWSRIEALASRRDIDRLVPLGSLGRLFRQDSKDFPGSSYLVAAAEKVMQWRARVPAHDRLRVGISWRGGTPTTRMFQRSLVLADFAPLLLRDDCSFVSLQYGDVAQEITAFNQEHGERVLSFDASETHDLDDLAALVAACDVIVTVQNTNVHLAGALGVRCEAILPVAPEWRYGVDGESMLWYKSVHLLRRNPEVVLDALLKRVSLRLDALRKQS